MKSNPFSFLLDQLEQKLPDSLRPVQAEAQAQLLAQAEARIAALEAKLEDKGA